MPSVKIIGPFFSNPFQNDPDPTIHEVYQAMFNAIQPNSKIRLAFYMWSDHDNAELDPSPQQLNDILIEQAGGGDIQIILDNDWYSHEDFLSGGVVYRFKEAFGESNIHLTNKPAGEEATAKSRMHNKSLIFSELKFAHDCPIRQLRGKHLKNVVVHSSANIWRSQYRQSNDLVIFYNDDGFYKDAISRWNQIRDDLDSMEFSKNHQNKSFGKVKVYSFPRKNDIVVSFLNNIINHYSGWEAWFQFWRPTRIKIAMAHFSRGRQIEEKLVEIRNLFNTDVAVVIRKPAANAEYQQKLIDYLISNGIEVNVLQKGTNIKVHNKFMTLHGRYPKGGNVKWRKIVWTGSENYTSKGLKQNSEVLYKIEDDEIYNAYYHYWHQLKAFQ